ncbi:hypothetical protein INR76_07490 [Marixanthomonas sp. SCSIO 43207]|uniref:hypothetical protein n=1 Tax=Marixanthomonas sp. SCSIO 43207 TaxID=2779360 RepID=UPI001CAA3910|nr:hypothetical protein [Marixanthomonas sp. SCSIO 43207]UAB79983.1 hypothetical protein INR76_07490 [Marixanthomonas sp. SCSIO 43207]
MKKTLLACFVASVLLFSCDSEKDPFAIGEGSIGNLDKTIQMKEVDSIFATDSIVKLNPIENALGTQGEVEIYDTDGNKLLLLSPEDENDPNATITNVQVFDSRYKTEKGLNSASTFKDVKTNYTVSKVETTINSVVVFLKDSEIYLTIDKKELPENLRYNPNAKIETSQIPDDAKFKYFMIGWEPEATPEENPSEKE